MVNFRIETSLNSAQDEVENRAESSNARDRTSSATSKKSAGGKRSSSTKKTMESAKSGKSSRKSEKDAHSEETLRNLKSFLLGDTDAPPEIRPSCHQDMQRAMKSLDKTVTRELEKQNLEKQQSRLEEELAYPTVSDNVDSNKLRPAKTKMFLQQTQDRVRFQFFIDHRIKFATMSDYFLTRIIGKFEVLK